MFITPDLDKQERLKNKELREELWKHRKDGEENLIIHAEKKRSTLKRRPRSNLGFKIDYCAVRVVEANILIIIIVKQIRG